MINVSSLRPRIRSIRRMRRAVPGSKQVAGAIADYRHRLLGSVVNTSSMAGSLRRLTTRPKQRGASKGATTSFNAPAY
jgi:hypothetical protein